MVTATSSTSGERGPRRPQRVGDDGVDQLEVMARGDLGHDAAVAVVDSLRGDHVRADRRRRASITAAHVSSQLVSIARITAPPAPGVGGVARRAT